jgi:hypothetical protein
MRNVGKLYCSKNTEEVGSHLAGMNVGNFVKIEEILRKMRKFCGKCGNFAEIEEIYKDI